MIERRATPEERLFPEGVRVLAKGVQGRYVGMVLEDGDKPLKHLVQFDNWSEPFLAEDLTSDQ